jgi:succinoglycan biosynthesis transport protein ExoP
MAALMVATSGARTLVIDSDLHRRKLSDALAPGAREGLIEALHDPSRLPAIVAKAKPPGPDVLPCGSTCRVPNAAELLGSADMERLLTVARQSYDYIIIEIAPIMSVVDVKTIERFIDGFVFVVEWGETKRTLVLDALSDAQAIRDRIVTVVLNKIDPVALRDIESYKGARSGEYYQN